MYEQITVIGYVGKVIKKEKYLRVTIGASSIFKDKIGKDQSRWYSVTLWDERRVGYYGNKLQKGDLVLAVGAPDLRLYGKKEKNVDFSIVTEHGGRFRVIRYVSAMDNSKAELLENQPA
jgi:hypothetical protein